MKPAQYKRATIVGFLILIGTVIFIAGVLTLGGQRKTFEKTVAIKAVFNDVNGLQAGNNIWISGVKVGTVKKVGLFRNSQVEVTMHIEQRSLRFIPKDARAKIGSDGLIGNRIIVIYGGSPDSPIVQPNDFLTVDKSRDTDEMLTTLQENNKNLLAITKNFKVISAQMAQGQGTLGKLLKDETLINHLQTTINTLELASTHTRLLTSNLAEYSGQLQTKGTLFNDLVTDTTVFNSLKLSVSEIQEISKTANNLVNNLNNVSNNLNNINTPLGTLLNDKEAAVNLKATLVNLETSTHKLDENMEALQHNFLFRGFFKKRAKGKL